VPRKSREAAPDSLAGPRLPGLLRSPFAAQGRSYKDRAGSLVRGFAAKVLLLFFGSLPFAQQCLSHFALFQVY